MAFKTSSFTFVFIQREGFWKKSSIMKEIMMCTILLAAILLPFSCAKGVDMDNAEEGNPRTEVYVESEKGVTKEVNKCPMYPRPIDCEEVLKNGNKFSGIYTIWPKSRVLSKCHNASVYCDMTTEGGGWTVIQRRGDFNNPEDYFNKNWHEYKVGFGKLKEEFWLGNDNIMAITNQGRYSVRFEMTNKNGTSKFAQYNSFWTEDEDSNYKLHLLHYSGDAGNALAPHHLREFYTRDKPNIPNDVEKRGKRPPGGWWYNIFPSSNLNGINRKKPYNSQDGIMWNDFGGYANSMKSTEIKVRSVNC